MSNKNTHPALRTKSPVGLTFNPKEGSFAISVDAVPAAEHFFFASDFRLAIQDGQFHIIFGFRSPFDSSARPRLAIELAIPLYVAKRCFVDTISKQMSANGKTTFLQAVQAEVRTNNSIYTSPSEKSEKTVFELPTDPQSYRSFPSSLATSSICTGGQVMIEFLEAPPDMIVNYMFRATMRGNAQVRSVVGVILSPAVAVRFYEESDEMLKAVPNKEEEA